MKLIAVACFAMTMAVLTACTSDNDDNPVSGSDSRIVGKWCSDVSGKTFAKDILPNSLCRFDEGYEQCDFHKLTGWGNWLRMNQQRLVSNPESGGGGKMEQ